VTPATPWVQLSATASGWTNGTPENDGSEDFFIDFLFEGTGFFAAMPASYTELSVAAASFTELSVAASTYTELTL
jgi:hypothetical protein